MPRVSENYDNEKVSICMENTDRKTRKKDYVKFKKRIHYLNRNFLAHFRSTSPENIPGDVAMGHGRHTSREEGLGGSGGMFFLGSSHQFDKDSLSSGQHSMPSAGSASRLNIPSNTLAATASVENVSFLFTSSGCYGLISLLKTLLTYIKMFILKGPFK